MKPSFITIGKVSSEGGRTFVYPEIIRLDDIKSIRIWGKTEEEKASIKGEMIGIYMKGNDSKTPTLRVAESLVSFQSRIESIGHKNMKDDSREEKEPNQERG